MQAMVTDQLMVWDYRPRAVPQAEQQPEGRWH